MNILVESKNYIVYKEYELVMMKIKKSQRTVRIGDFYGDVQMAIISPNENFCAMCGCGVIIYYLNEPFKDYEYHIRTRQWREWGRDSGGMEIWVNSIKYIGDDVIEIVAEDGNISKLNIIEMKLVNDFS